MVGKPPWIGVLTLFPEMFEIALQGGVLQRSISAGHLQLELFNLRDFATNKHRNVDDRPFGGGAGMVLQYEPLVRALTAAKSSAPANVPVVLMSPQGRQFQQVDAVREAGGAGLILICGRYEGLDERFVETWVEQEWSVGDYVLSGGELPALTVIDAVARHIPGTLGNSKSVIDESHLDGLLDYPHYTRPENVADASVTAVPPELLSGDHQKISEYRRRTALKRTLARRPDLLVGRVFSPSDRAHLQAILDESK